VRWMTRPALQRASRLAPQAFAPWFQIYLERWDELRL
jgi:hypothetical protein